MPGTSLRSAARPDITRKGREGLVGTGMRGAYTAPVVGPSSPGARRRPGLGRSRDSPTPPFIHSG